MTSIVQGTLLIEKANDWQKVWRRVWIKLQWKLSREKGRASVCMRVPKSGLARRTYFWILRIALLSSRVIVFPYQASPKWARMSQKRMPSKSPFSGHQCQCNFCAKWQNRPQTHAHWYVYAIGWRIVHRKQQFKKTARNYGGHFIEASIGMVFQVRFWEHGKVAMGSCSLLPIQLWWDNVLLPLAMVVCIAKSIKLQPPFQWNAWTYAVNVQNCFHWKGDANFLVQKT